MMLLEGLEMGNRFTRSYELQRQSLFPRLTNRGKPVEHSPVDKEGKDEVKLAVHSKPGSTRKK
jgi:hypothetical protein